MKVDEMIVICRGCGGRRTVNPEIVARISTPEDLKLVMEQVERCDCGHPTVNVQLRVPDEKKMVN